MPPNQTQVRTIKIKVDVQGDAQLKKVARSMGTLNKETKKISNNLGNASLAFRGFLGAIGVRELAKTADTFQLLRDRISVFAGSTERATDIMGKIAVVARHTNSPISTIAEGFNRVAIATQGTGLSMEQMLGVTQALQQTLRLSGAGAQEATSTFLQFTQALSLGRLQGQELRAVMLSNAKYSGLLADTLKVQKGELKQLGEQGKITSEVMINSLSKNFQTLEADAGKLGTTFEQSTIIVLDTLRVKLHELNTEFELSSKFKTFAVLLIDNMKEIFFAVATLVGSKVIVTLAVQLATLSKGITALSLASKLNIIATAMTAIVLAAKAMGEQIAEERHLRPLTEKLAEVEGSIKNLKKTMLQDVKALEGGGLIQKWLNPDKIAKSAKAIYEANVEVERLKGLIAKGITVEPEKKGKSPADIMKEIADEIRKKIDWKKKGGLLEGMILLNAQFRLGKITLAEYQSAIERSKINELTKKVNEGKMSLIEYNQALLKIPAAFEQMSMGKEIMFGLKAGVQSLRNQFGTMAGDIAKGVGSAFSSLEDQMVSFVRKGKFSFRELTNAILDDMAKIAIRQAIIRPLAGAVGGLFDSSSPQLLGPLTQPLAKGGVLHGGNILPFARGGVVSNPTLFPMANGAGLMGEAGPEAILPLTRGANGKLGVQSQGGGTVVNVINNSSGTETETQETVGPSGETRIDVLIVDKVKTAIGDGRMDRTFKEVYGISRRGR